MWKDLVPKKDKKLECNSCLCYKEHGSTYCLDCEIESNIEGYNQAIDDFQPLIEYVEKLERALDEIIEIKDDVPMCEDRDCRVKDIFDIARQSRGGK